MLESNFFNRTRKTRRLAVTKIKIMYDTLIVSRRGYIIHYYSVHVGSAFAIFSPSRRRNNYNRRGFQTCCITRSGRARSFRRIKRPAINTCIIIGTSHAIDFLYFPGYRDLPTCCGPEPSSRRTTYRTYYYYYYFYYFKNINIFTVVYCWFF